MSKYTLYYSAYDNDNACAEANNIIKKSGINLSEIDFICVDELIRKKRNINKYLYGVPALYIKMSSDDVTVCIGTLKIKEWIDENLKASTSSGNTATSSGSKVIGTYDASDKYAVANCKKAGDPSWNPPKVKEGDLSIFAADTSTKGGGKDDVNDFQAKLKKMEQDRNFDFENIKQTIPKGDDPVPENPKRQM
jgi:hypothetical protein